MWFLYWGCPVTLLVANGGATMSVVRNRKSGRDRWGGGTRLCVWMTVVVLPMTVTAGGSPASAGAFSHGTKIHAFTVGSQPSPVTRLLRPPVAIRSVPGDSQVVVSWTNPKANRGIRIVQYTVIAVPGGQRCSTTRMTSCTVRGLLNGTGYRFRIKAISTSGTSRTSALSPQVTPFTAPEAPSAVSAIPGDGQAQVTWTPPSTDGGAPITGYAVVARPGDRSCETSGALTCTVAGLTNGIPYTFSVTARNTAGSSRESATSPIVTPRTVPSVPRNASGVAGDRQVSLSWQSPNSDGGSPITGYVVIGASGEVVCEPGLKSECVISGLTNGTSYSFDIRAVNAAGRGALVSVGPLTPVAASQPSSGGGGVPSGGGGGVPSGGQNPPQQNPSGINRLSAPLVAAYNVGGTVTITWNRPSVLGSISGFKATVSSSASGLPEVGSCQTAGAHSCAVDGLAVGVTYYVTVAPIVGGSAGAAMTAPKPTQRLTPGEIALMYSRVKPVSLRAIKSLIGRVDGPVARLEGCQLGNTYAYEVWSPDGRYMAFATDASTLVPNDTNCATDIFVQDLVTGEIRRASETATGVEADTGAGIGGSVGAVAFWSPDGQWLAFWSNATTLAPGVTGEHYHLYIKRMSDGELFLVDANSENVPADKSDGMYAYWSPDSAKIAFKSSATNLMPGPEPQFASFYIKDLATGSVSRVSEGTNGEQPDSWVGEPPTGFTSHRQFWSADGTRIAFTSGSSALVPGDTNGRGDVFVKDLVTGQLVRASVDANGEQLLNVDCLIQGGWSPFGNRLLFECSGTLYVRDFDANVLLTLGDTGTNQPSWAPDGSAVAYVKSTGGFSGDAKLWNLSAGTTSRLAESTTGFAPAFSPDGSRVAYVGIDFHMWVVDLATMVVTQVDTTADGVSGDRGVNTTPKWSPDGSRLSFETTSSNLVSTGGGDFYKLFIKTLPQTANEDE